MTELIIAILLLLFSSALASGTEAALFAIPKSKVMTLLQENRRGAAALSTIKEDMARPIMAIVIINNIANIIGSIVVGSIAEKNFGNNPEIPVVGIVSGVLTFLVILFAEIIPKTVGENRNAAVSLFMAPFILFLTRIFFPLIWITEKITLPISSLLGTSDHTTSEKEILALTELGRKSGVIEENESTLIQRVFDLNDVTAWDIMTPIARVDALEKNRSLQEIKDIVMELTHTRIPVYNGSLDKITGVVHVRDILKALAEDQMDLDVGALSKEASFIPDTQRGNDLLHHFKRSKQHLAIVVDAFGTVLGVLSLEDVLEELVGEIIDETDVERHDIIMVNQMEIVASVEADTLDISDIFDVELPEQRLGEFLLESFGRIPRVGDRVSHKTLEIIIEEGTPRMVQKVRIKKNPTPAVD